MRLLFVCLGNICRSPAAEAVMNKTLENHGISGVTTDSAGTTDYHEGEPPDARMTRALEARGFHCPSLSRPVTPEDFASFDYILAMDRSNLRNLTQMTSSESERAKIHLMCDYCQDRDENEVPDPYYGGAKGFQLVIDILEDACQGFVKKHLV